MKPRFDYVKAAPEILEAQLALSHFSRDTGLEPSLQELVKTRAS